MALRSCNLTQKRLGLIHRLLVKPSAMISNQAVRNQGFLVKDFLNRNLVIDTDEILNKVVIVDIMFNRCYLIVDIAVDIKNKHYNAMVMVRQFLILVEAFLFMGAWVYTVYFAIKHILIVSFFSLKKPNSF